MSSNNIYYVYQLVDPRTNLPFYVGKGKNDRAKTHLWGKSKSSNDKKDNFINEIRSAGQEVLIEILHDKLDEKTAYEIEETLIRKLGRIDLDHNGVLTNKTFHSLPPSRKGAKVTFSEEHKDNLSKASKGKPKKHPPWNKGLTKKTDSRIAEYAKKRSETGNEHQRGLKYSKERVDKVRNALLNRIVPEEQKQKMSAAKKGKTWEEIFGIEEATRRRTNKKIKKM